MIDEAKCQLNGILSTGERILSLTESSSKNSIYVLFRKHKFEYMPIRISNHPKNSFFSNKTFYKHSIDDNLLSHIRYHLDHSDWYTFKYEDYFALKMLRKLTHTNLKIYIDNTMGIFDESKMGLLFYQIRYFGRNHKEMNTVSESFQKYLRRLFSAGLINGKRLENNDLSAYITQLGKDMIDEYTISFEEKYISDKEGVDLKYVEIPMDNGEK